MSYDKYMTRGGTEVYLCWNCGRIHLEENETQHGEVNMEFITKLLEKLRRRE